MPAPRLNSSPVFEPDESRGTSGFFPKDSDGVPMLLPGRLGFAIMLAAFLAPGAMAAAREFDIEVGTRPDGSMYVEPSNITASLGDDVTFRVKNVDRIFHDIALLDYDGNDVEIEVPAGRTETHSFKATVAGDFR